MTRISDLTAIGADRDITDVFESERSGGESVKYTLEELTGQVAATGGVNISIDMEFGSGGIQDSTNRHSQVLVGPGTVGLPNNIGRGDHPTHTDSNYSSGQAMNHAVVIGSYDQCNNQQATILMSPHSYAPTITGAGASGHNACIGGSWNQADGSYNFFAAGGGGSAEKNTSSPTSQKNLISGSRNAVYGRNNFVSGDNNVAGNPHVGANHDSHAAIIGQAGQVSSVNTFAIAGEQTNTIASGVSNMIRESFHTTAGTSLNAGDGTFNPLGLNEVNNSGYMDFWGYRDNIIVDMHVNFVVINHDTGKLCQGRWNAAFTASGTTGTKGGWTVDWPSGVTPGSSGDDEWLDSNQSGYGITWLGDSFESDSEIRLLVRNSASNTYARLEFNKNGTGSANITIAAEISGSIIGWD